ncbi:Alpha/beta hydrolase fold-1 [Biscogniauxia marginata]|nr:Alpha/beta hydrolase fold-1 [Biscogniauxia marginata]
MASTKPTLLFVHGAWHIPSTYSKFTNALKALGYEVHTPRLPSMNGSRPPNADLYTDTDFIRSYAESLIDAGRAVIAIMHSYGGHVGTGAFHGLGLKSRSEKGLPGGISQLIYLAAFAQPEGLTVVDLVKQFDREHLIPLAHDSAEDGTCVQRQPKLAMIGEGADDAEVEEYLATLVRWNERTMYQPVKQCAWKEIPVVYIHCTKDMTVPYDSQQSMVKVMEEQGANVKTVVLETGHCPNLTMLEDTISAIKNNIAA